MPLLDADEIDNLTETELVAAVDDGRVAPDDVAYALALAADQRAEGGDLDGALALADRAVAADPEAGWVRAGRAGLLAQAGRTDDALAAITELRPRLLTDALAASYVREVLQELDRGEDAEQWLTEALTTALAGGEEQAAVAYQLAVHRHELRHDLDLPHDELDDMAEDLIAAAEAPPDGATVVFWPQAEFERLHAERPELAADYGADWDEHRADIERTLAAWASGGGSGYQVAPASMDALAAADDDPDALEPDGPPVGWPPPRNDDCWCGSGLKYKKCCRPRSRPET